VQNKFCVTEFRTENSGYRQNKEETGRKELFEVGLLDMGNYGGYALVYACSMQMK
jgi:hypothetical protein